MIGSEFYFENFIVGSQKILTLYFRHGIATFHTTEGLGVNIDNLLSNQYVSLNTGLDLWHQPALLLGKTTATTSNSGWGGNLSGTVFFKIKKSHPSIHLAFQVNYKTAGYLEGEPLDKGFTGGFGISFVE